MNPNQNGGAGIPARDNVAEQLAKMAADLAAQMQELSSRVNSRLELVSQPNAPMVQDGAKLEKAIDPWPPYFGKVRQSLSIIQVGIYSISQAIDRLEL